MGLKSLGSSFLSQVLEETDENESRGVKRDDGKIGRTKPIQAGNRSSRPSLTDITHEVKNKEVVEQKSPTKRGKAESFLRKLPPPNLSLKPDIDSKKDLPSPIPLPPGVTSKFYRLFGRS